MKSKILIVLTVIAGLATGCNKEENPVEINNGEVHFTSGVSTRVSGEDGDEWDLNDPIGIYMLDQITHDIAENARNVRYTASTSGTKTGFTSNTPIYYPVDETQAVYFIAYHPHNTLESDYTYQVDVTNQTKQSDIDLLCAKANNTGLGYDKTYEDDVELKFNHKLTKIIFQVTDGEGLTPADLEDMTLTLKGLHTKAVYQIDTDDLTLLPEIADIKTNTTTRGTLYEAIVVPQPARGVTVEFALNNQKKEVFVYNMPDRDFEPAEKHIFNVEVRRIGVSVSGKINPWTVGKTEDGTAE